MDFRVFDWDIQTASVRVLIIILKLFTKPVQKKVNIPCVVIKFESHAQCKTD